MEKLIQRKSALNQLYSALNSHFLRAKKKTRNSLDSLRNSLEFFSVLSSSDQRKISLVFIMFFEPALNIYEKRQEREAALFSADYLLDFNFHLGLTDVLKFFACFNS